MTAAMAVAKVSGYYVDVPFNSLLAKVGFECSQNDASLCRISTFHTMSLLLMATYRKLTMPPKSQDLET